MNIKTAPQFTRFDQAAPAKLPATDTLTVLIPSYRRPHDLTRCLNALTAQTKPAAQIVVVAREDDAETWGVIRRFSQELPLTAVGVIAPGVVHALNCGIEAASSHIIAITDDDAAPHPDWIEKIIAAFEHEPRLGGVGGRDIIHRGSEIVTGAATDVGRIPNFGKMVGNHNIGVGPGRHVDVLKGVNCAYRAEALHAHLPDERLRGNGAQVHWEVGIALSMRAAGLRLFYDPAIVVDHHLGRRHDEDQRELFNPVALGNEAYNETLLRLERMPWYRSFPQTLWAVLIGTRACPGVVQMIRFWPEHGLLAARSFSASMHGFFDAVAEIRAARRRARS